VGHPNGMNFNFYFTSQSMKALLQKEKIWVLFILLAIGIYFSYYILTMEWLKGGGDTYSHFFISKNAFHQPELLLHHWGKPVYTLISAPFAQLGMKAVEFMNYLCLAGASWFAFLTCRELGCRLSWLTPVFIFFSPIVFQVVFSSLTEPLSALVLTVSVYSLLTQKEKLGMVLLSALLLIRNETIIFLPIYFVFLWHLKKPKAFLYVLTVPMLFTLLAIIVLQEPLWLISHFPYSGGPNVYGSGTLTHFLDSYDSIVHMVVGSGLVLGIVFYILKIPKLITGDKTVWAGWFMVVLVAAFVSAHSLVWWLGTGASAGLLRVLVLVIPLMAILAAQGVAFLFSWIPRRWVYVPAVIVAGITVYIPLERFNMPIGIDPSIEVILQIKSDGLIPEDKNIAYFHPAVPYYLNKDPFDGTAHDLIQKGLYPLEIMESGEFFIWDQHFGIGENRLSSDAPELGEFEMVKDYPWYEQHFILYRKK
jgi:hypothetical protein